MEILGTSVFVPLKPSLPAIQLAIKKALLQQKKKLPFRVCAEIFCSKDEINHRLERLACGETELEDYLEQMRGAPQHTLNCVLLADAQERQGVLLHRRGTDHICACLPVITDQNAKHDYNLALELAIFADKNSGTYVHLSRDIPRGEWNLCELLTQIALQLDPLSNIF